MSETTANKAQKVYWRVINDQIALATMPTSEEEMTKALRRKRAELRKAEREHQARVQVSPDEWDAYVDQTLGDLLRYRGQPLPNDLEQSTHPKRRSWDE